MRRVVLAGWVLLLGSTVLGGTTAQGLAQTSGPEVSATSDAAARPMPATSALLAEMESNQKRIEAMQREYTYHVHSDQQELNKDGSVKKTETEDSESLTIDGVRVNRVVARNGKALTPEEQQKESERIDKEVAKAKERRIKLQAKGGDTDARGDEVMPLSRILELGSFSNPRRVAQNGRSVIVLDYAGNPQAKTHSIFEGVMRDVVGTIWIDEADRVMVQAQGHFLNDFKLGGGMVADLHKGTSFEFKATRIADGVWLPAVIDGQGSVRIMLFAHFSGRMHVTTSDYRRFRTSATIVGSHGVIGPDGVPVPDPSAVGPGTGADTGPGSKPQSGPETPPHR